MTKHYVDTTSITHLSLCTGYGGIDLGLARVVSNLRTIAYCEREAAAIELLLSRMENGQLDAAPIWTDLRSFPWEAFSDRVDILSGGYPCQPFSAAGKRLGAEDERHLWPAIADGVRILRPRICFFENVEGHITLGLSTVISDLEELGYEVSWGIFSAAEVGAPHQRKRVFIMAYRCGEGLEGDIAGLLVPRGRQKPSRPTASGSRSSGERGMADSNGTGSGEDWKSSELADPTSGRCDGQHSRSGGDVGQWTAAQDIRPKVANSSGCGTTQIWPSRPGEPQHWWEPPRVVANTEFIGRRGRGDGDARGLCGEIQIARPCGGSAEPAVADTRRDQCERRSPVGEVPCEHDGAQGAGEESGVRWQDEAGEWSLTESGGIGAEPAVGNATGNGRQYDQQSEDRRQAGAIAESSKSVGDTDCGGGEESKHEHSGLPPEPSGSNAESVGDTNRGRQSSGINARSGVSEDCRREGDIEQAKPREVEPKVGGGVDGPADWVGYGKLCVSNDNRTNELRMLGNGVVPATAARAFLTLMEELNNSHEQNRATTR